MGYAKRALKVGAGAAGTVFTGCLFIPIVGGLVGIAAGGATFLIVETGAVIGYGCYMVGCGVYLAGRGIHHQVKSHQRHSRERRHEKERRREIEERENRKGAGAFDGKSPEVEIINIDELFPKGPKTPPTSPPSPSPTAVKKNSNPSVTEFSIYNQSKKPENSEPNVLIFSDPSANANEIPKIFVTVEEPRNTFCKDEFLSPGLSGRRYSSGKDDFLSPGLSGGKYSSERDDFLSPGLSSRRYSSGRDDFLTPGLSGRRYSSGRDDFLTPGLSSRGFSSGGNDFLSPSLSSRRFSSGRDDLFDSSFSSSRYHF